MSRLFANVQTIDELVGHFGVDVRTSAAVPSETVEETSGFVVIQKDGPRLLKSKVRTASRRGRPKTGFNRWVLGKGRPGSLLRVPAASILEGVPR